MDIDEKKINEFLKKVEKIKTSGGVDLSAAEDLSIAVTCREARRRNMVRHEAPPL
ncbi:MAG: hypothetical protein UY03_C0014G0014 [Parcubacteria group bacterium GW2011_GWA2_47_64]|nr:MAG: hypothetical protein UY03_C0014G0014 [Parcubacteria group bacterium GW2011_GWA2_47_64]